MIAPTSTVLLSQTKGFGPGVTVTSGLQVATTISSIAQSLPPPPGALFLITYSKPVSAGPVL